MRMNQTMNLPAMQAVMMEFQRQSEIMDMKEEMMEESMDDMFEFDDNEGTQRLIDHDDTREWASEWLMIDGSRWSIPCPSTEEATEEIISQVLDEIGIGLNTQLADAPAPAHATPLAAKEPAQRAAQLEGPAGAAGGAPPSSTSTSSSSSSSSSAASGAGSSGSAGVSDADLDIQARLDRLRQPRS